MTAPAAIRGTLANVVPVKTRSVVQFVVEVSVEHATEALNILGGYPVPGKEPWVALARLDLNKKQEPAKQLEPPAKKRRRFSELPPTRQAALKCKERAFQLFCHRYDNGTITVSPDEHGAATFVREFCGVLSRSELNNQPTAADHWARLLAQYEVWLMDVVEA